MILPQKKKNFFHKFGSALKVFISNMHFLLYACSWAWQFYNTDCHMTFGEEMGTAKKNKSFFQIQSINQPTTLNLNNFVLNLLKWKMCIIIPHDMCVCLSLAFNMHCLLWLYAFHSIYIIWRVMKPPLHIHGL